MDSIPSRLAMLWAVHISDGVLHWLPCLIAAVMAMVLLLLTARKLDDAEIPRIGVMTAAFFVASQIHIPIAGISSAHLLLNGLMAVVLGYRAMLSIAVGLLMQAMLFGHGGWTTLGVNVLVYSVPILPLRFAIVWCRRSQVFHQRWLRFVMSMLAMLVLLTTLAVVVQSTLHKVFDIEIALISPWVVSGIVLISLVFAWLEQRLEANPEFPLGLWLGGATAYLTVSLNVLVLMFFGQETLADVAGIVFLSNAPIILVEAVMTGFVMVFLAKAKPEWLA
jgi:cobalt/nickel transport system permease protein